MNITQLNAFFKAISFHFEISTLVSGLLGELLQLDHSSQCGRSVFARHLGCGWCVPPGQKGSGKKRRGRRKGDDGNFMNYKFSCLLI